MTTLQLHDHYYGYGEGFGYGDDYGDPFGEGNGYDYNDCLGHFGSGEGAGSGYGDDEGEGSGYGDDKGFFILTTHDALEALATISR